ncbi:LysM peptidoglycan-binding domain-containing protein [Wenzhouxiangella sp. XN79A]|uniref:LysM peptidoglycan-binding domain-containing protein n=1 Tax=Wenzhouxiangella sp. XN79A TaxID=2724193 RepID=UPI00144A6E65|nr:LysM peptidoglycan-binding domain-containing protein [Wenzhouxiangella sp. XN79A]NKI34043.1 LysM peptidoglycan-binding domain-containing protein [Wenzhouxiangella sp. XN79A]
MNSRILFLVAAGLALTGCAVETRESVDPAPPSPASAIEPSPSDPFQAVDEAFARMALDQVPVEPGETGPRSIWPRLVERFAIAECPADSRAEDWANWYADNHEYLGRVFNRARPWLHEIANEVERRDLPGELALLPVVESAFDPFAYSHARAAGPWQFLSGTARDHGIVINDWYDGRRDFVAATDAALDYLEYLNGLFDGDWALAIAAYNAGQGRVMRAVRRNLARGRGTAWDELSLPRETRGYVPKLKGLGCLFRDPAAYGYRLPELLDQPRVATLDLPGSIDLVELALLAELDLAELITLNAGLNKHRTPPSGPHHLTVPLEAAERARAALAVLPDDAAIGWQEIEVRPGDSLSVLARRHDTSIDALRKANGLNGDRLIAGQTLRLPGSVDLDSEALSDDYLTAYRELAALQQQLLPADRFIHRVRSGESLWVIARRYGLSVRELQQMNGMGSKDLIKPGQRLVIETGRQPPPAAQPARHVVQRGDSLWNISRRHRVGLDDLMRWNDLDADSVLQPGQQLIIRAGSDA